MGNSSSELAQLLARQGSLALEDVRPWVDALGRAGLTPHQIRRLYGTALNSGIDIATLTRIALGTPDLDVLLDSLAVPVDT